MNDVIIVGGGLSGLATATYCARAGFRTLLLERATELGGRAQTETVAGHTLNLGPHALYVGGAARRVLAELGVTYRGTSPAAAGALAIAGGELHALPAGLASLVATDLLGFGAKIETARALASIARTDASRWMDVTWRDWVDRAAAREETRAVLHAVARVTTYGNAPDRMSAGATLAQAKLALDHNVLYLDGGWRTLVDGLATAARAAGVTITPGAHAVGIDDAPGGRAVILGDGEHVDARAIVICAGPSTAATLLGHSGMFQATPSRIACLDLGLSALPSPKRRFALGIDQPTYFSVHSATAKVAERGATVHVAKYLDPDAARHPAMDERELEGVLDLVQPGWRDRVVARRFMPALIATNALLEAKRGGARPGVDASGAPGVFLAGDWVGDEGMLADCALASARAAAQKVIGTIDASTIRTGRAPEAILDAS